jgi:taurine dioxygenase
MLEIDPITPVIGATVSGLDFSRPVPAATYDEIYQALLEHLVIFMRGVEIGPAEHLAFARNFGDLDEPHLLYPHVEGFENIVLLENDADTPPDTNCWHTDLTFKAVQPFASVLIARQVPEVGGDTMWSSCYAAYERLPDGLKSDLEGLEAVHDLGDFRNTFAGEKDGKSGVERLNESVPAFGHNIRPLIGAHPVTGRKFLNFNEAFTTHIVGLTTNDANSLKTFLANHMNKPEDQVRWRWRAGDLAMWDNRVTMHYALADYLPQYRCMNRVTVVRDRRVESSRA